MKGTFYPVIFKKTPSQLLLDGCAGARARIHRGVVVKGTFYPVILKNVPFTTTPRWMRGSTRWQVKTKIFPVWLASLANRLASQVGCPTLAGWLPGWPARLGQSPGWLAGWLCGWLAAWLAG